MRVYVSRMGVGRRQRGSNEKMEGREKEGLGKRKHHLSFLCSSWGSGKPPNGSFASSGPLGSVAAPASRSPEAARGRGSGGPPRKPRSPQARRRRRAPRMPRPPPFCGEDSSPEASASSRRLRRRRHFPSSRPSAETSASAAVAISPA